MNRESKIRNAMVRYCASLHARGFSVGTAGNVSVRLDDGYLMTPTNVSLGELEADQIARLDGDGKHIDGAKPSKEILLHHALYETRPEAGAVVHLHSTYATALSCLEDVDPDDCVTPLTPYVVMRVGRVPLVPYVRPGDPLAADLIRGLNGRAAAVLLANHGPVVSGVDLFSAVCAAEELEETAKLLIILRGQRYRVLSRDDVAELEKAFPRNSGIR